MNSIKISELKILFEKIIDKLETEYGKEAELELKTIIYRVIPTEKDRIATFVDFDRLASILREVSQVENPVD